MSGVRLQKSKVETKTKIAGDEEEREGLTWSANQEVTEADEEDQDSAMLRK